MVPSTRTIVEFFRIYCSNWCVVCGMHFYGTDGPKAFISREGPCPPATFAHGGETLSFIWCMCPQFFIFHIKDNLYVSNSSLFICYEVTVLSIMLYGHFSNMPNWWLDYTITTKRKWMPIFLQLIDDLVLVVMNLVPGSYHLPILHAPHLSYRLLP